MNELTVFLLFLFFPRIIKNHSKTPTGRILERNIISLLLTRVITSKNEAKIN